MQHGFANDGFWILFILITDNIEVDGELSVTIKCQLPAVFIKLFPN